ncbi:MAG: hypothetical protein V7749_08650 [Cocleimonas sp.]
MKSYIKKNYVAGSILVLGDSQPNGHGHPDDYIFPSILAKKLDADVLNVAFQDKSISDNLLTLKFLVSEGMRFEFLIFNVNPSHPKAINHHWLSSEGSVDYRFGIFNKSNVFKEFSDKFNPTVRRIDFFYRHKKSNSGYYLMTDERLHLYERNVQELISLGKKISNNIIIYETPYEKVEALRLKIKLDDLPKFSKSIKTLCLNEGVYFMKPDISGVENYNDVVHFSEVGHVRMAGVLYDFILNIADIP